MTRGEVDAVLVSLGASHDRIAAAMYTVDSHAGLAFLRRGHLLSGTTARVGNETLARVDVLWAQFTTLGDRLELARAQRAVGNLANLTSVLRAPAVRLDEHGMPLDESAAGKPAQEITLMEFVRRLESATGEVTATFDRVDAACTRLAARIGPLAEALAAAWTLALAVGGDQSSAGAPPARAGGLSGDLDRLGTELTLVTDEALADPLRSVDSSELEARLGRLETELDAVRQRLTDLERLRAAYPRRIEILRTAVAELAAAEGETARSYGTALEKIADPGLPPAPAEASGLRDRLSTMDGWQREGRWERLADELTGLDRAITAARQRARQLREAADGLLARRAELRGRLAAYQAKAARFGLVEDVGLSARHSQAHDLLYTRPCDLPAATRAVFAYQQALADLIRESP